MKKSLQNLNIVQTAYCPYCRGITNLNVSIILRSIPGPDGKTEPLITRTYHCESCRSFVRSEDEVSISGLGHEYFLSVADQDVINDS